MFYLKVPESHGPSQMETISWKEPCVYVFQGPQGPQGPPGPLGEIGHKVGLIFAPICFPLASRAAGAREE